MYIMWSVLLINKVKGTVKKIYRPLLDSEAFREYNQDNLIIEESYTKKGASHVHIQENCKRYALFLNSMLIQYL